MRTTTTTKTKRNVNGFQSLAHAERFAALARTRGYRAGVSHVLKGGAESWTVRLTVKRAGRPLVAVSKIGGGL